MMGSLVQLDLRSNTLQGPIPADFLQAVNPLIFEHLLLNANKLTGTLTMDAVGNLPVDSMFQNMIKYTFERRSVYVNRGGVVLALSRYMVYT
eukprot:9292797-Ditylum_brightwellii.AAC.1